MSDVNRYGIDDPMGETCMFECDQGEWRKNEDYEKLEAENKRLENKIACFTVIDEPYMAVNDKLIEVLKSKIKELETDYEKKNKAYNKAHIQALSNGAQALNAKREVKMLKQVIESAIRISDLWKPPEDCVCTAERAGEIMALSNMHTKFKDAIESSEPMEER